MLLPGGPKIQMDSSLTHPTQGQNQDFTFLMLSHQVCFGVMCFFLRFCQPPMSDSNISINVLQIWHCKASQKWIRNNLTFRHPELAQTYTCVNAKAGARSYLRRGGRGPPLPQPRARERVQPAFCRNKRPSTSGRWIQLADDAHNHPRGRPTAPSHRAPDRARAQGVLSRQHQTVGPSSDLGTASNLHNLWQGV